MKFLTILFLSLVSVIGQVPPMMMQHYQNAASRSLGYDFTIGLLGWWKCDEGTSTTAADSSSQANNATLQAAAGWGAGKVGSGSLSFNGNANSYARTLAPVNSYAGNGSNFTTCAWVKVNTTAQMPAWACRTNSVDNTYASWQVYVRLDNAGPLFSIFKESNAGNTEYLASVGHVMKINEWHHLGWTYDGTNVICYIDGRNIQTFATNTKINVTKTEIRLGNECCGFLNGYLDDVRVYDRTLVAAEMAALAGPPATPTGLMAWYSFDNADLLTDKSGNGFTGVMTNSASYYNPGKIGDQCLSSSAAVMDGARIDGLKNWSSTQGTIGWWMYHAGAYNSGLMRGIWGIGIAPGIFNCQIYNNNNWYIGWANAGYDNRVSLAATAANYPQNTWMHYCYTWTPTGSAFYTNGTLCAANTVAVGTAVVAYNAPFYIGCTGIAADASFNGYIDDFKFYTNSLSSAQINYLYKETYSQ